MSQWSLCCSFVADVISLFGSCHVTDWITSCHCLDHIISLFGSYHQPVNYRYEGGDYFRPVESRPTITHFTRIQGSFCVLSKHTHTLARARARTRTRKHACHLPRITEPTGIILKFVKLDLEGLQAQYGLCRVFIVSETSFK